MNDTVVAVIDVLQRGYGIRRVELLLTNRDESATWSFRGWSETAPEEQHFVLRAKPAADDGMASSLGFESALALLLVRLQVSASDLVRVATQRHPVVIVGELEVPVARIWPWFDWTLFAECLTSFGLEPVPEGRSTSDDDLDGHATMKVFGQPLSHQPRSSDPVLMPLVTALSVPMPRGARATGIIFDGDVLIGQVGEPPNHAFLAFVLERFDPHPASWIPYPTAPPDERGLPHRGYVHGSPESVHRVTEGPAFGDVWFRLNQPVRTEPGDIHLFFPEDPYPDFSDRFPDLPQEQ